MFLSLLLASDFLFLGEKKKQTFQKEMDQLVIAEPVVPDADLERFVLVGVMEELRGLQSFVEETNWRY